MYVYIKLSEKKIDALISRMKALGGVDASALIPEYAFKRMAAEGGKILRAQVGVKPTPDFEELDHPYARRQGSIKYAPPKGGSRYYGGDRKLLVHTDEGEVLDAVFESVAGGTVSIGLVGGETVNRVVEGTKVMLPRDVVTATFDDPSVQERLFDVFASSIKHIVLPE